MSRFAVTPRFIAAQCAALCLSLISHAILGTGYAMAIALCCMVLVAAGADFALTPGKKSFAVNRVAPPRAEQGITALIRLEVENNSAYPVSLTVSDSPPATAKVARDAGSIDAAGSNIGIANDARGVSGGNAAAWGAHDDARDSTTAAQNASDAAVVARNARDAGSIDAAGRYSVGAGDSVTHSYALRPSQRGVFPFGDCYFEVAGRLGLCGKRFSIACASDLTVYPNLALMRHYRLRAPRNQLLRDDASIHRLKGIGTEFAGLREYTLGDDRRKINWKATARALKLITNDYESEKNRDVIIAIDTGRWMQAPMGEVSRLDKALEIAAGLMQVAISSGDRAGLALYGSDVSYYLAPGKGSIHIQRFLHALYGAKADSSEPSLIALCSLLRTKLSKRCFVCMFTYVDNEEQARQYVAELAPIKNRHSLFVASLSDVGVEDLAQKKAEVPSDLYLKAAAALHKSSEEKSAMHLRRHRIEAGTAEPSELILRSIHRYLSVKRLPQ